MRVVVVGAGIAGLTATRQFTNDGHDVTLIEAGTRLGGRVRTIRATVHRRPVRRERSGVDRHAPPPDACPARSAMACSCKVRGSSGRPSVAGCTVMAGCGARPISVRTCIRQLEALESIVHEAAQQIDDPARPATMCRCSRARRDRRWPTPPLAPGSTTSPVVPRRDSQGEFAAEPARGVAAVRRPTARRQRGERRGQHDPLASRRRRHRHLGTTDGGRRRRLDHDERGVGRRAARRRVGRRRHVASPHARQTHVVLACSLVPLRSGAFDPPLPDLLRRAIDELGYGTVTKTAIQFAERQWPAGYATVEGIAQRMYEPTVDQPGTGGVLMSYAGRRWRASSPSGRSGIDCTLIESEHARRCTRSRHRRRRASRGLGRPSPGTAAATPSIGPARSPRSGRCCADRTDESGWPESTPRRGPGTSKARSRAANELQGEFMQRANLAMHAPK